MLVTSNFSFSHIVFKRLVSQGRQKLSLCGNGLNGKALFVVFQNCSQPLGHIVIGRRAVNQTFQCSKCCSSDHCNNVGCGTEGKMTDDDGDDMMMMVEVVVVIDDDDDDDDDDE